MLYAFVSLWFCLSGNPSHINQERFNERLKAQKVVRSSPTASLLIHLLTSDPEERWATEDTKLVKAWPRVSLIAKHGRAIRPLAQMKVEWIKFFTEEYPENKELRQLIVAVVVTQDPTRERCETTQDFLRSGLWWANYGDCDFQSFTKIWEATTMRILK